MGQIPRSIERISSVLMDSSQFEGADFTPDVCQIVDVEHFFYGIKSKTADKKIK